MTSPKNRFMSKLAVYLILEQGNKVLLMLRQNTGFADGLYSLASGHIDEGESATEAMIREAQEELGITIAQSNLHFAHVVYYTRKSTGDTYTNFYFYCNTWDGQLCNNEPDKCCAVEFYAYDALPDNTLEQVKIALEHVKHKQYFSEYGWHVTPRSAMQGRSTRGERAGRSTHFALPSKFTEN